ncbi:MAG TPA: GNAT family N-acetyltransferase [Chitinophagaceae bacterium]|jgi:GNAT superfamily N-acetyltransferase
MPDIILCNYDKQYAKDFKRLNLEWIEKYFVVEEHDLEQLSYPEEYIIDKGGEILFAVYEKKVVGVCALIKTADCEFELAKMAVSPHFQGKQIGYKLGGYAIETARLLGAKRIWLESNRILAPAISLYIKLGFKEIPITTTPYARADIRMELLITEQSPNNLLKEQAIH